MKILVADFDAESRSRIERAFRSGGQADTIWEAEDGEEAVCLARLHHPDLVMMAMAMPRIDGLEATRLIKARNPEIKIIVMSVLTDPVYSRAALLSGADEFLPKTAFRAESDLSAEEPPVRDEGSPETRPEEAPERERTGRRPGVPRGFPGLQWSVR